MKKHPAAFVLGMLFLLLLNCTILSFFIERELMPRALFFNLKSVVGTDRFEISLPRFAVKYNAHGPYVFAAETNTKGEKDLHVKLVEVDILRTQENDVLIQSGSPGEYLAYVSKPIAEGAKIEKQTASSLQRDLYLITPKGGTTLPKAPPLPQMESIIKNNRMLICAENATQPFIQEQVRHLIFGESEAQVSILSLNDIRSFATCLPRIAVCTLLFFVPLLFSIPTYLGYLCRKKGLVIFTAGFTAILASYIAFSLLLNATHLPFSLLPHDNFFDFSHYNRIFSTFYFHISSFPVPEVEAVLQALQRNFILSAVILCFGLFLLISVLIFGMKIIKNVLLQPITKKT